MSGPRDVPDDSKKYEDLQEKVLSYLCQGLSPPEVQASIKEEYSVALSLQHITKLNSVLIANRDAEVFSSCATFVRREYGATPEVLENPLCLYYQDPTMKSTFEQFPEIIFLAVSRTFCKQTIITVACQDSFGKIEVIAAGILNSEDKSTFSWFLETFKQHNEYAHQIRVVVLATNVSRFKALKEALPTAYLFIHDPLAAFANDLRDLNINFSEKEVKSLLYKFQDLMNTDTKAEYNKEVMELRNIAQKEVLALFMSSWDQFEKHWVYGSQNNVAKFISRAGKAFTSVMNLIGGLGQKQFSGLNQFVRAYHTCIVKVRDSRAEAVDVMLENFEDIVERHSSHAVAVRVYKHLTPVAADAVLDQYNKSVSSKMKNMAVSGSHQRCECPFFEVLNLPCLHIFIKKRKEKVGLKIGLFEESECNKLWTWEYAQQNALTPKQESSLSTTVIRPKISQRGRPKGEVKAKEGQKSAVLDEDTAEEAAAPPKMELESSDDELMVAENLEDDSWSSDEDFSEMEVEEPVAKSKSKSPTIKVERVSKSPERSPAKSSSEVSNETLYQNFAVALDITACVAAVLSRSDHGIFEERISDLQAIAKKWEVAEDDNVLKRFDIGDFQKAYEVQSTDTRKDQQLIDKLHKNFSSSLRITSRLAKFLSRSSPAVFKQRLADLLFVLRKWRKSEDSQHKDSPKSTTKGSASIPSQRVNSTGAKEFGLRKRKVVSDRPGPQSRKRKENSQTGPASVKKRKIVEARVPSSETRAVMVLNALKSSSHLSRLSTTQKKQLLMTPSVTLQDVNVEIAPTVAFIKEEDEPHLKEKLEMCGWMIS